MLCAVNSTDELLFVIKTAVRSLKLQLFTVPESHYACFLASHCGKIHNSHCFIVIMLGRNRITVQSCVQRDDGNSYGTGTLM